MMGGGGAVACRRAPIEGLLERGLARPAAGLGPGAAAVLLHGSRGGGDKGSNDCVQQRHSFSDCSLRGGGDEDAPCFVGQKCAAWGSQTAEK